MKKFLIAAMLLVSTSVFAEWQSSSVVNKMSVSLQNAITESGKGTCHKVVSVFDGGNYDGSKWLSIGCGGNNNFIMAIRPDGSGKVLSCKTLESVGGKCFRKM